MEQYAYKDLTLHIFKDVMMEDEFRDFSDVGIVIQAYLRDAESDLLKLRQWVAERGTPITVRLVNGHLRAERLADSRLHREVAVGCELRTAQPISAGELSGVATGVWQSQPAEPVSRDCLGQKTERPQKRVRNSNAVRHGGRTGSALP
jgi:hypothetical protein